MFLGFTHWALNLAKIYVFGERRLVYFFNDCLTRDGFLPVKREARTAIEFPSLIKRFADAHAKRVVIRPGEQSIEFHEQFYVGVLTRILHQYGIE